MIIRVQAGVAVFLLLFLAASNLWAQDKPVFTTARVVIQSEAYLPFSDDLTQFIEARMQQSDEFKYRPISALEDLQNVRNLTEDILDEFDPGSVEYTIRFTAQMSNMIRNMSYEERQQFREIAADFILFPTVTEFVNTDMISLLGHGALILEMNFLDVTTGQVFSIISGGWSPLPVGGFASQNEMPGTPDSDEVREYIEKLANDAVFALEQTYTIQNQAALNALNEIRFVDISTDARKPNKILNYTLMGMGIGLLAYSAYNLTGLNGTATLSPYGSGDFLSTIGIYGGLFWSYATLSSIIERPFLRSEKLKYRREYRRITGERVPAIYDEPERKRRSKSKDDEETES